MFAHLHVKSAFSFLHAGSSPEDLVKQARNIHCPALALTDKNGIYGAVRFLKACKSQGIQGIIGSEVTVENSPVVLLVQNETGYANLCHILTAAHSADRENPAVPIDIISTYNNHLFCLTGGKEGTVWHLMSNKKTGEAERWLRRLHTIFRDRLYIELCHTLEYGAGRVIDQLYRLSVSMNIPVVASNNVRHAVAEDYVLSDLLTCIGLGHSVDEPHLDRPKNAEAYLKNEKALKNQIPYEAAFENTMIIANACHIDLVPEHITPPKARLPDNISPRAYLNQICSEALLGKYAVTHQDRAMAQYNKEFGVITQLGLEEYFLVVREVVEEARRQGIRCYGRGSAANSIVAYLLGITGVDPIAHNLLFERFLHGGRKGTPDIDIDFDSERRNEIITWIENRFSIEQTAMTATIVTYQLRNALRDVAKALGWPMDTVNQLTKAIPSRRARNVREYRPQLLRILGESPLFELLVDLVERLDGLPRHMGLHVGGMVLSRKPLYHFSPIQVSANGVNMVQFDKNDVEALGLVKLDVLGLRMLATLSEGRELVARHINKEIDLDQIPLDDPKVYDLICSNSTVGLFQIESQGQIHLLAVNQPRSFGDLIAEIALFRPGPLQGGMVHPFIRRRKGQEPIEYDHPGLEPVLADTYGIILFQEQILEIAHRFAGMSLSEADNFRSLMSKYRDASEMENMRDTFVSGAMERGVSELTSNKVFDKVSKFVGYGFCRSHAAAFAKIVYQSAWMKCYYPMAYMAAIMQHRPGMYSLMTLEQEAKHWKVAIQLPDIKRSATRYDLVKTADAKFAILKPLTSIDHVSDSIARDIVWQRMNGTFTSVEDLYERVTMPRDALDSLARSGALDSISASSRDALWKIGVLARRLGTAGQSKNHTLFHMPTVSLQDIPCLPELHALERLSWDYQTHHAARVHPISLIRRSLSEYGILPIAACRRLIPLDAQASPTVIEITGNIIMRQRPPTANGIMFLTLEDETGFIQCVLSPPVQEAFDHLLILPTLTIQGILQAANHWRGLVAGKIWPVKGLLGGYSGYPSQSGGQDQLNKGHELSESNDEISDTGMADAI